VILGAFGKKNCGKEILASSHPSVCQHGTDGFPAEGFLKYFAFLSLFKIG
jgi:hypothetical protein